VAAGNINVIFEDSKAVKCGIFSDTQVCSNTALGISNFGINRIILIKTPSR